MIRISVYHSNLCFPSLRGCQASEINSASSDPTNSFAELTEQFDAATKIVTIFLPVFFLKARIRNSALSHQKASKKLLVHEIEIGGHHFRLKRLIPIKLCIYSTMSNE